VVDSHTYPVYSINMIGDDLIATYLTGD